MSTYKYRIQTLMESTPNMFFGFATDDIGYIGEYKLIATVDSCITVVERTIEAVNITEARSEYIKGFNRLINALSFHRSSFIAPLSMSWLAHRDDLSLSFVSAYKPGAGTGMSLYIGADPGKDDEDNAAVSDVEKLMEIESSSLEFYRMALTADHQSSFATVLVHLIQCAEALAGDQKTDKKCPECDHKRRITITNHSELNKVIGPDFMEKIYHTKDSEGRSVRTNLMHGVTTETPSINTDDLAAKIRDYVKNKYSLGNLAEPKIAILRQRVRYDGHGAQITRNGTLLTIYDYVEAIGEWHNATGFERLAHSEGVKVWNETDFKGDSDE